MRLLAAFALSTTLAAPPLAAQQSTPSSRAATPARRTAAADTADPYLARARRVLRTTPLIDGHNDLPWTIREDSAMARDVERYDLRRATPGHTDLARLKTGMVGAQFWSVYVPG